MDQKTAWIGFSPAGWINEARHLNGISHAFPSGVTESYNKSAFMGLYPLALDYLGIPPMVMVKIMIALQIGLIAWAFISLARALKPDASPDLLFILALLVIASNAREMNLARFAASFFDGLYYIIADAMRIFALARVIKKQYLSAGVFLLASFLSHLTMGMNAALFIAAMLITPSHLLRGKSLWAGAAIFVLGALAWLFYSISPSDITGQGFPHDLWINLTRMMTYHWYPVDFGVFTSLHQTRFAQFLGFCLLIAYYLTRVRPIPRINLRLLAAFAAMALLIGLGIFYSVHTVSVTLIKLCLARASDMIVNVGLVVVVLGLDEDINSENYWISPLALAVLISPFYSVSGHPGWPVLVSLSLTLPAFRRAIKGPDRKTADTAIALGAVLIIALLFLYQATGMGRAFMSPAYTGGKEFLKTASILGGCLLIAALLARLPTPWLKLLPRAVVFMTCLVLAVSWLGEQGISRKKQKTYTAYQDVQVWANRNTAPDSLFLVDPSLGAGWREYSNRASWGTAREWLYYSWLYSSNYSLFKEGANRLKTLGINFKKYLAYDPPLKGWMKLRRRVKNRFNAMDDKWRMKLARRYGIDYFVVQKRLFRSPTRMPVVYQNDFFMVLAANLPCLPSPAGR
ncbi:hypothetical protein [Dethiosulfatarculus sandiegensis]|uniref:hypothetical protein n=1 Tax=Dethiosulfatarculus sandiegensis TaxID=1429043 RepID=UPI0012E1701C|nr:hypothetical protein [Dethiosulfatarculus sandiegensis]